MIIETVVSTMSSDCEVNFAPMGIWFPEDDIIALKIYHKSNTYRNLTANPSGVANLISDVEIFVNTALYNFVPPYTLSEKVSGGIIKTAEEIIEFTIDTVRDQGDSSVMAGPVMSRETVSETRAGLNRGRMAVIEALIAVTKIGFKPSAEIEKTLQHCAVIVEKTGGSKERSAMQIVEKYYEWRAS